MITRCKRFSLLTCFTLNSLVEEFCRHSRQHARSAYVKLEAVSQDQHPAPVEAADIFRNFAPRKKMRLQKAGTFKLYQSCLWHRQMKAITSIHLFYAALAFNIPDVGSSVGQKV